jgi:putative transposase
VPTQRCTVHKHRNLLAHAPDQLHEEIAADDTDMIYAATPKEVEERCRAFIRKWRLKCRAVADSLEEAGDRLFTFIRLPQGQVDIEAGREVLDSLAKLKRHVRTTYDMSPPVGAGDFS